MYKIKWKLNYPLATARQPCSQGFSLQHEMDGKSPSHFLNGKELVTKNRSFSTVYFSSKSYLFFVTLSKLVRISKKKYPLKDLSLLTLLLTNFITWTESWMGPGGNEIYIDSSIWYGNNQSGRRKVNIKNGNCSFFSLQTCFLLNLVTLTILWGKKANFHVTIWNNEILKYEMNHILHRG